jgi:hypothetical protein
MRIRIQNNNKFRLRNRIYISIKNILLCAIHGDTQVTVNHEGEQVFFALECGWKRLSFVEGECFLLERHILEENRFGKAVNKTVK